jgi:hypothetical protein
MINYIPVAFTPLNNILKNYGNELNNNNLCKIIHPKFCKHEYKDGKKKGQFCYRRSKLENGFCREHCSVKDIYPELICNYSIKQNKYCTRRIKKDDKYCCYHRKYDPKYINSIKEINNQLHDVPVENKNSKIHKIIGDLSFLDNKTIYDEPKNIDIVNKKEMEIESIPIDDGDDISISNINEEERNKENNLIIESSQTVKTSSYLFIDNINPIFDKIKKKSINNEDIIKVLIIDILCKRKKIIDINKNIILDKNNICFFYQINNCFYGNKCKKKHININDKICIYNLFDKCKKLNCKFKHIKKVYYTTG